MTTSAETARTSSSDRRWTDFSPWADSLSKLTAGVAIAVYASGFLIVSIYHSKYGFIGVSPFRPRIIAAGAWFYFFALIPISIAMRYRNVPWMKVAQDAYTIWVACTGISIPLLYLLFNPSDYPPASSPRKYWWVWALAYILALGVIVLIAQSKKFPPLLSAAASVGIVLFFMQAGVRELVNKQAIRFDSISVWFFAVFIVTVGELKIRSGRNLLEHAEWSKPLVPLFAALLVFAQYYYPYLKSSWGGGAPVGVTICFTKDSAISSGKTISAELVEEADEGLYIVGSNESKAIFVPRSSVAYILFSSKTGDSELLH